MQLNLGTKKSFSETNMRRIISILTGLMSSVSSLEDQCIKEYDENVTYSKGQIVIGSDGYFYEAKTVATGAWDVSKWTKIGTDDITELDVDTIKSFLGLTQDQLDTLASIISTEVRLDKCFSSSDTYTRIQDALKEAKQYCITELAKKSTGSFKKANDVSEVTDGNYLYLIYNSGTAKYDIYALVDSNVELLTSVDVNLDDYFTKTEIEADFLKKTDAASTYATITTVDGKVDKASILSTMQDTDNTKVFGAKVVYDTFNQKTDKINCYEIKDSTGKSKHIVIDLPASHSISGKTTRLFVSDDITAIGLQVWNGSTLERDLRVSMVIPNHLYIPTKALTPVSTNINFTNGDSSCHYTVINGICYVNIWSMNITANLSVETLFNNLPTAKASAQFVLSNSVGSKTVGMGWISAGSSVIACNAKLEDGTDKSQGYARFSYPVAESWNPS